MIEIDGSHGEGGGQILRSALTLSMMTQVPFVIYNIRRKRRTPGLRPQHLACVRAAKEISSARTRGDEIGSLELEFYPGCIKGGTYKFEIGTAGSIGLLLQTVILPLFAAGSPSFLEVVGGTHVPWSPCYHYLDEVYGAILREMGGSFSLALRKWGFYPRGGGVVEARIYPSRLSPISIKGGVAPKIFIMSAASRLPAHVAERQARGALGVVVDMGSGPFWLDVLDDVHADSPGSVVFIWAKAPRRCYGGFMGIGRRGLLAEHVGQGAAEMLMEFLRAGAGVDSMLSDQLIIPALFSGGMCEWVTSEITNHFNTNVWVTKHFGIGHVEFFDAGGGLHDVRVLGC